MIPDPLKSRPKTSTGFDPQLIGFTKKLPENLRRALEYLSSMDLSEVCVHYNSFKPCEVSAKAYAFGTDIYIRPEQEHLLPHECWHIVQQMQGRVTPTGMVNGFSINDESELEREADIMGTLAYHIAAALDEGYLRLSATPE